MFEKYKSTLVNSFGVKESDIALIRKYSDELNLLLTQYKGCKESSDKEAFEFYKANYQRISFLFGSIYEKLTSIITPTIFNLICGKMELEYKEDKGAYKKKRLKNVLVCTYLAAYGLNDSITAEDTWHFYADDGEPHTYFYADLLWADAIITDTNKADPASLSWIDPVELMKEAPIPPEKPQEVEKPIAPLYLQKPTEPKEVHEPTPPTPKDKPEFKEEYKTEVIHRAGDIMLQLEDKTSPLLLREEITSPVYYNAEIAVSVAMTEGSAPAVTVYGTNGEKETTLSSLSELAALDSDGFSDVHSEYTFYGWSQSPTENIPLPDSLTESISVYRLYEAKERIYNITFSIDGKDTVIPVKAGELPSHSQISTEKESDTLYDYTFEYFYPAIRRANKDTTYTAQYSSSDRIYSVTFNYGKESILRRYKAGSTIEEGYPNPLSSYIDKDTFYQFEGWDKPLAKVTEDTVYTAIYTPTLLANAENTDITVTETPSGYTLSGADSIYTIDGILLLSASAQKEISVLLEDGKTTLIIPSSAALSLYANKAKNLILSNDANGIAVHFTDSKGNYVMLSHELRLRTPHGFENDKDIYVVASHNIGIKEENIPCSISDGYIEFSAVANAYYKAVKKHSLTVADSKNGSILLEDSLFAEGEVVRLRIYPNSDFALESLTLVNNETGKETVIDKSDRFTMPSYDVTVRASFAPVEYKITFVFHDRTETVYCKLGEMPKIPEIPQSFTIDGMFYTFIGWSTTVSMATEDTTYTAKYYSILEKDIVINNRTALEAIKQKYVIPFIIVFTLLVAAICALIIILRKRKKAKMQSNSNTAQINSDAEAIGIESEQLSIEDTPNVNDAEQVDGEIEKVSVEDEQNNSEGE